MTRHVVSLAVLGSLLMLMGTWAPALTTVSAVSLRVRGGSASLALDRHMEPAPSQLVDNIDDRPSTAGPTGGRIDEREDANREEVVRGYPPVRAAAAPMMPPRHGGPGPEMMWPEELKKAYYDAFKVRYIRRTRITRAKKKSRRDIRMPVRLHHNAVCCAISTDDD